MRISMTDPFLALSHRTSLLLDVSLRWKVAGLRHWLMASLTCLLAATAIQSQDIPSETVPLESVDAATRSMWLMDGVVLDATSLRPLKDFSVTPGTLSTDQHQRTSLRWRENLKREMKDGRLRWPRTSGFSVMRFRVTADGYNPAVTQRIWRGGPHTRIQVRMKPID
jgi:hypothetical protein